MAVSVLALPGGRATLAQQAAASPAVASRAGASFDHDRHAAVTCIACHGTGERHRSLLVRTPAACNACHHPPGRAQPCLACHARAGLPEPGALEVRLSLSVWSDARTRRLRFGHALHERVECLACHAAPGSTPPARECGSCHAEHHDRGAECTTCHGAPPAAAHGADAHLSCAGRGCHEAARAPVPVLSRSLCLVCHPQQRMHEVGGDCALCHQVPRPASALAGTPQGRP